MRLLLLLLPTAADLLAGLVGWLASQVEMLLLLSLLLLVHCECDRRTQLVRLAKRAAELADGWLAT